MQPTQTSTIPIIETRRLRLRGHETSDLVECVSMWSDPEIARYTIGSPSPPQRTWLRMLAYRGHWSLLGFGYWAVEERDSGRFVGELGFADFRREIQPSLEGMPEAGWVICPRAQGKGYASEALQAAHAWADKHFPSGRTACIIHRDNQPSLRIAEKFGYREILRGPTEQEPEYLLARNRSMSAPEIGS